MQRPRFSFSLIALLMAAMACPMASAISLPVPVDGAPALRIQGSNTIGAQLAPALVLGLLKEQGARSIQQLPGTQPNEVSLDAVMPSGDRVSIDIAAHGSSTGFLALKMGQGDLAASSRPIKGNEAADLSSLGDLRSGDAEHVIAIDGVAVVVNSRNPLRELSVTQLASVFSGDVHDWQQLGAGAGAGEIHVYARDQRSGTFDTFNELVLTPSGKKIVASAKRFESSEALSDAVSHDPQGIGFIGLPYVRRAKALAIIDGDSSAMLPTVSLIATEDYPLSRRLYLYFPARPSLAADTRRRWAEAFVQFAQSPQGQLIVAQNGFVAQTVQAIKVPPTSKMPLAYQALARDAERLSVNFRFTQGSATLDNKARMDIKRVVDYLKLHDKLDQKVTLAGFGDAKTDPTRARLLSRLRAMAICRELMKNQVTLRDVVGFGDEMPVATNTGDEGRIKNRRVEVWVQ